WTVNPSALDATLDASPANPTSERSATFRFTGNGTGFECSLDGAAFVTCPSEVTYPNLSYGEHVFQVRVVDDAGQTGAATRFPWTITNAPPVANSQTVTTLENEPVAVMLTASDSDTLAYRVVTLPLHGVLLGAAPDLSYAPNIGFYGSDSF